MPMTSVIPGGSDVDNEKVPTPRYGTVHVHARLSSCCEGNNAQKKCGV